MGWVYEVQGIARIQARRLDQSGLLLGSYQLLGKALWVTDLNAGSGEPWKALGRSTAQSLCVRKSPLVAVCKAECISEDRSRCEADTMEVTATVGEKCWRPEWRWWLRHRGRCLGGGRHRTQWLLGCASNSEGRWCVVTFSFLKWARAWQEGERKIMPSLEDGCEVPKGSLWGIYFQIKMPKTKWKYKPGPQDKAS